MTQPRGYHQRFRAATVEQVEYAFWRRLRFVGNGNCREWDGPRDRDGYGIAPWTEFPRKAHRLAWFLAVGPIPEGLVVAHYCDNPACCEPSHLWVGTQADNLDDMRRKRRDKMPVQVRGATCRRGHPYTPENTIERKPPYHGRECRECKRIRNAARFAK
jgi:hypothetical protein